VALSYRAWARRVPDHGVLLGESVWPACSAFGHTGIRGGYGTTAHSPRTQADHPEVRGVVVVGRAAHAARSGRVGQRITEQLPEGLAVNDGTYAYPSPVVPDQVVSQGSSRPRSNGH